MDNSIFTSRSLTIVYFSRESNGTLKLPDHFNEHLDIQPLEGTIDDLPETLSSIEHCGAILAVPSSAKSSSFLRSGRTQVQEPLESVKTLEKPEEQRRFVNRIYGYDRWKQFRSSADELHDLIEFHSREKLTLLVRDPQTKEELGHTLTPPTLPSKNYWISTTPII